MSASRWELIVSAELGELLDVETIAIVRAAMDLDRARIRESIATAEQDLRRACAELVDRWEEPPMF